MGVFDTLYTRGGVSGPGAAAVLATLNGLAGVAYSIIAEVTVINPTTASTGNVTLLDGASDIQHVLSVVYQGASTISIYGTLEIPRYTLVNGTLSLVAGVADATAFYATQLRITPLRGSFNS